MAAKWPTSVATDADLYVAVNSLQTTLSTGLGTGDTSVVLASATGFPTAGAVTIDNEVIFYTGVSGSTLTGCTRGSDGTTAAIHSVGVPVGASIVAFHHNGLMAEIEAIETSLNLTASRAIATNASGRLVASSTTDTELGYVHGVTSAIQTQLNLLAPLASPTFTGTVTVPALTATNATNQLVLSGPTRTLTITAPQPATSSRTWTIPDIAGNGTFAALEGTQTFTGVKTFSGGAGAITLSASTIAMGTNKITGLAAASANGDAVRWEQIFGFRVLQIVTASTTTGATSTSTTFADTNLTATITPTASTSTILVLVSQSCEATGGNGVTVCSVQLLRGASILTGPHTGGYQGAVVANDIFNQYPIIYLDSPATTSATTYKTQFARGAGTGTAGVNSAFNGIASKSTITLIELG